MSGVHKLEIQESSVDLKALLASQKTASGKERVQFLYLLKSQAVLSIQQAAELLGRHRVTLQKWAQRYREGGLEGLLEHRKKSGRPSRLTDSTREALEARLEKPEGFGSYEEIQEWLAREQGIEASYSTVHRWVRYELGAKLKVPRPVSELQDAESLAAYKKTL
jgi:transposase